MGLVEATFLLFLPFSPTSALTSGLSGNEIFHLTYVKTNVILERNELPNVTIIKVSGNEQCDGHTQNA